MASERAKYSVEVMFSTACRTRQRSIMGVKLGAAIAANTATMATTTITSRSVKPRALPLGLVRRRVFGGYVECVKMYMVAIVTDFMQFVTHFGINGRGGRMSG